MSFRDDQARKKMEAFERYILSGGRINVYDIVTQTGISTSRVRRLLKEREIAIETRTYKKKKWVYS